MRTSFHARQKVCAPPRGRQTRTPPRDWVIVSNTVARSGLALPQLTQPFPRPGGALEAGGL
ncbi:hypothetical protein [Myxococcus xanthus]|uniref:hypothetical protein n=1 Tax=Myxococcus xanthus TaxID=34 RepID=UPI00112C22C5|nr:hypothetical protein [Myxococcus xanthus]